MAKFLDGGEGMKRKAKPEPRPSAATCPACHLITTDRHCQSPTCNWFVCRQHEAVVGVIGPSRTYWMRRPR